VLCVEDRQVCDDAVDWLREFYILSSDPFPQLAPGKFMLAAFSWQEALAREALAAARFCRAPGGSFLAELKSFPAPGNL
jgi:hypothetical protein